jgi:ketosteroid isomerase-like protein
VSTEAANLVRAFYGYSAGRDLVEALSESDFVAAGHAAFDHLMAPRFEFVLVRDTVGDQGSYRGRDALLDGMRDWLSSFRSYVIDVVDVIDLGARVLVLTDEHGVSRTGAVPVRQRGAVIWTFRDAGVERIETYMQPSAALDALAEHERARLSEPERTALLG